MYENLKDFGEDCAIDGKFLDTYKSKLANEYTFRNLQFAKDGECNIVKEI